MITTIIISVFLLGMNQPVNSLPSKLNEEVSVKQLFAEHFELKDTIPPIPDTLTVHLKKPGAMPTVDFETDYPSDMPIKMLSFEWPDFSNMPIISFEPVSLMPSVDLSGLSNLNGFASLPQVSFQPIPHLQLKPISLKPLQPISIPSLNGIGTLVTPSDTTKRSSKVQSLIIHGLSDTLVLHSKNLHAKIVKADSVVVFPFFKLDSLGKSQVFDYESFQRGNEQKLKDWQESSKMTIEELQKHLQVRNKEIEQKFKEWQESYKPTLEELNKQLQDLQKENEQKMKEWQQQLKLLQEEMQQLLKEQGKSGKK